MPTVHGDVSVQSDGQFTNPNMNLRGRLMTPEQHATAYQALLAAETAQRWLASRLDMLVALIPDQLAEEAGVKALVQGCEEEIGLQGRATHQMLKYIPREFRKPAAAAPLAARVFGTPELLERILLSTQTRTAFDSMAVSKDWFNTITNSPKVLRKLGLLPDPDANISMKSRGYITHESGIQWNVEGCIYEAKDEGVRVPIQGNCGGYACDARVPGSRLSSVLLTQPPIRDLEMRTSCCAPVGSPTPTARLHNVSGITIGEVCDKLHQLRYDHRLCPHAALDLHDTANGFVYPFVNFKGYVNVREDDPWVQADRSTEVQEYETRNGRAAFEARMRPYMRAKRAADDHCLPVPTLEEFEAEKERRDEVRKALVGSGN